MDPTVTAPSRRSDSAALLAGLLQKMVDDAVQDQFQHQEDDLRKLNKENQKLKRRMERVELELSHRTADPTEKPSEEPSKKRSSIEVAPSVDAIFQAYKATGKVSLQTPTTTTTATSSGSDGASSSTAHHVVHLNSEADHLYQKEQVAQKKAKKSRKAKKEKKEVNEVQMLDKLIGTKPRRTATTATVAVSSDDAVQPPIGTGAKKSKKGTIKKAVDLEPTRLSQMEKMNDIKIQEIMNQMREEAAKTAPVNPPVVSLALYARDAEESRRRKKELQELRDRIDSRAKAAEAFTEPKDKDDEGSSAFHGFLAKASDLGYGFGASAKK